MAKRKYSSKDGRKNDDSYKSTSSKKFRTDSTTNTELPTLQSSHMLLENTQQIPSSISSQEQWKCLPKTKRCRYLNPTLSHVEHTDNYHHTNCSKIPVSTRSYQSGIGEGSNYAVPPNDSKILKEERPKTGDGNTGLDGE